MFRTLTSATVSIPFTLRSAASLADESTLDDSMADESTLDDSMADESTLDDSMADESMADESMADESMAHGMCTCIYDQLGNIEISEKKKHVEDLRHDVRH